MRSVLACVDLSVSSAAVIDCARALAAPDGKLTILHVAAPDPEFVGYEVGPDTVRDDVARELRREHRAVQDLADAVSDAGITVTPLTVQGVTVDRIIEHAERLDASFIVVASSGHGVLHNLLFGSSIPGLLHRVKVPVVVVPAVASR